MVLILMQGLIPISAFASDESGFSAESLTIQPGETAGSIKLTWYAPADRIKADAAGIIFYDAEGGPTEEKPAEAKQMENFVEADVTDPTVPTGKDNLRIAGKRKGEFISCRRRILISL